MLILDATNKTITAVLAGAITTSQPEASAAWADDNGTSLVEGATNIALNSTTPVTLVGAPASSTRRIVKDIYIENKDTVAVVLTVMYNNNATTYNIQKITLQPGESWSLQYVGDRAVGSQGPTGATGGTGPTGATGGTGATGPSGLTVGTTTIASGTATRVLYNNAGVLGEYTLTGTGTVNVMQTSPSLLTSLLMDSGFVMNWASSNVVLTHSSGILTLGTGEFRITTPGTNAASVPTLGSTSTLTNKRITRRIVTVNAPGATPTTNSDNDDIAEFTGLGTAITSMSTNLSGTPINGDLLEFRFVDDGTARAITWGASFAASTVSLPTTTVISTMLRVLFEYQTTASLNKWVCIAVA